MTYLREALTERVGEFIQLRRDIHRHPELAFEEHRTSELVAAKLESWGYAVHRGLGGTGVVGTLRRGTSPRRLGLRADMDALPIQEATGAEWASSKPGLMHACGHDGHTAMLLAAAKAIAQDVTFDGTLNLIFQPAEEGGGGALRMMADGLFEQHPCDAVFAMHNILCFAMARPWPRATTSPSVSMARVAMAPCRIVRPIPWWRPPPS
jgi:hippurate hydrolase